MNGVLQKIRNKAGSWQWTGGVHKHLQEALKLEISGHSDLDVSRLLDFLVYVVRM